MFERTYWLRLMTEFSFLGELILIRTEQYAENVFPMSADW